MLSTFEKQESVSFYQICVKEYVFAAFETQLNRFFCQHFCAFAENLLVL